MSRWAAIVAGGSGTRFWPLSTPTTPKQMLSLAGGRSLLEQAVSRLEGLVPRERILVVTGKELRQQTVELLRHLPEDHILGEPRPASTGPALTWATVCAMQHDDDASVVSTHADWVVGDDAAFRATAERAFEVAERHDVLVTVGMVPTRPDVGYGYIEPGAVLEGDARRVARFTEKPDERRAAELVASGALWNSGMFAWTGARFLEETRALAPEIAQALAPLETGRVEEFFAAVTPIPVDYSHFERSERVAVVPGTFPWDDVGTWSALARVRPRDESGNVLVGEAHQREAAGCILWAEDGAVVVDGVDDLVVVRANGITLVTTAERSTHLKELLASLPPRLSRPGETPRS